MVSFNSEEKKKKQTNITNKPLFIVSSTLTCRRPKRKTDGKKAVVLVKILSTQGNTGGKQPEFTGKETYLVSLSCFG